MDYSFGGGEEYSDWWLELARPALARTRSWSNYSMPRSHTSPGIALWCQGIARFVTERKTQISQTYDRVSAGCSPALHYGSAGERPTEGAGRFIGWRLLARC